MPEAKLYIKVGEEFYERFKAMSERLGLTMSQFGNMCVQTGFTHLVQAISPADAFTPGQIVAIIKEAEKQGLQLDFTDFQKKAGEK